MSIPSGKGRKGDPSIYHPPERRPTFFALLSGVYHQTSIKQCSPNVRKSPNIIDKYKRETFIVTVQYKNTSKKRVRVTLGCFVSFLPTRQKLLLDFWLPRLR